jgi:UDP-N-acetyl-D-mannosaminuronic acid dehydrogenase
VGWKVKDELIGKIRKMEARIVVVGLGRVGLPLAAIFADAGFQVIGVDVKREVVETVSSGRSRSREPGLDRIVTRAVGKGRLKATTKTSGAVKNADIIIVCVQTPLTEDRVPDLTSLRESCEAVASGISRGKLVVVESTVPPGAIRNLARILEGGSGLTCGEDFWLAYCPERIAVGKAIQEFLKNSRIVGGFNLESAEITVELFRRVIKGEILITDCQSAELAKLAENTFRDVNIAFANEIALVCERLGVDVREVIRLANTHLRVNIHKPGCGVGGPCLPKDPYLLQHQARMKGLRSRFIELSREMNDYMPEHVVKLVTEALENARKGVKDSKIAVLGTAYRGEVGEAINSPAEKVVRGLVALGAEVVVYDPYCDESFGAEKAVSVEEAVRGADCVVLATDHKTFGELDLDELKALMSGRPVIVDGRRIMNPREVQERGFIFAGVGWGV